jgi:DNA-binding Lrp family transcriptional regulator
VGPFGKYNFLGKVALKDLNKLHEIIEELESYEKIKHVDSMIWTEATNIEYPQNLIIKPLDCGDNKITYQPTIANYDKVSLKIDDVDRKIAKILTENSRTPFKKIAAQIGISNKTVTQRYKKLRENLLTLSSITLNLNNLGYKALANIYLKISNRSKMSEIYLQLFQIPNLIVVIRLVGPYDLYCAVALEDFNKFFEANDKIRRINGIETTEVYLTKMPPSWPLNLFGSLLENEAIQPKYWPTEP